MLIQLGKKKPTPIEAALLKEAGLDNIKGNFITGYYLEPPEQLKITVVNGVILLDDEPLIHQHLSHNQTVRGFTLDIDGLCRKLDSTWNEQSKVDARNEQYKKEYINARLDVYKKFESALEQNNRAEREICVANDMFAPSDNAVRKLNAARAQMESIRVDYPDIYIQYLNGMCYNLVLRRREPNFLTKIAEVDILAIETERFNSQDNAFDPTVTSHSKLCDASRVN